MRTTQRTGEQARSEDGPDGSGQPSAEAELRQRYSESEAIRQILSATATELKLPAVLDGALRGTLRLTGLEGGTVCLVNSENQTLELAASVNASPEVIADLTTHRIRIGDYLCGHCAKNCQPLVLWDNASGSAFATREATRNEGIRFHAAFPLRGRERCIGVLCLFAKSDKQPTERSLALVRDVCGPIALAIENTLLYQSANREVAERTRAEERLRGTNRTLRMMSRCNQVLVRAEEEAGLLGEICRIVVEEGGYRMAWVGFALEDEARTVAPVAQAGFEEGYLERLGIVWADTERGRGPAGTAIRTGQPCVIQDVAVDPRFEPWRAEAEKRGYASVLGCPLPAGRRTLGVLTIYAAKPGAFDPEETKLLGELAQNLAFGLVALRTRAERESAEKALRGRAHLLTESQRIAHIGTWSMGLSDERIEWAEETYRIYGVTPGDFVPTEDSLLSRLHPEDRPRMQQWIGECCAGKQPKALEFRIRWPSGEIRTLSGQGDLQYGADHVPIGIVGTVQDITERKQAEEVLRASHERMQRVLEVETVGVMFWDLNTGRMTDANDAFLKLMGYSRGEVEAGKLTWQKLTPPEYLEVSQAEIRKFMATGRVGPYEKEYFRKDGTRQWLVFAGSSLGNNSCVEFCVDISARKRAEAALRQSEARLAQAVQVGQLGIFEHEHATDVVETSREMRKIFGFGAEEQMTFAKMTERMTPEDRDLMLAASRRAHDPSGDGKCEVEHRIEVPGRGTRWVGVRAQTFFEGEGSQRQAVRTIGAVQDITEQKDFQAELERLVAQRTAQLAEANANLQNFAYTAAHDLRSPLRGISGFAAMTLEEYGERLDPMGRSMLERVVGAATQMGHLLSDLLEYSKITQAELRLERVPLDQVVQDGLRLLEEDIRAKEAEVRVEGPLPEVVAHPATVAMLVCNLVSNGLKFVPTGVKPRLRVRAEIVRRVTPPATQIRDLAKAEEARSGVLADSEGWVRLWVEDNGIGIAPKDQAKVFGAFQRLHAKGTYPGTGLGLAIVSKGVERMGGRVGVESEVGKGSRFWLELRSADSGVMLD